MKHSIYGIFSSVKWHLKIIFGGIIMLLSIIPKVTNAQIESGSFDFDGHNRNYKICLPDNYSGTANLPLVFNLHPIVYDAMFEMGYTRMHVVADTFGYIIVYPSAVDEWNTGALNSSGEIKWDYDDVGFISALIDTLDNLYSIDLERIYACGFSAGGFMALRLACELGHRIAAVASVGGTMIISNMANCDPTRNMPVLLIHGTDDQTVSIGGDQYTYSVDQTIDYWIDYNNCVVTESTNLEDVEPADNCTVEKISYTSCDYNCNVLYYKVHGGGHGWPGGNETKYSNGNLNMDMNAGYEIMKFFNEAQLTPASVKSHKIDVVFNTYPNPFDTETTISFQLQKVSKVELKVYSSTGQEIRTFLFPNRTAGTHTVYWDGTNNNGEEVSGGLYLITVSTPDFHTTGKVLFMR
jgi:polyhydroxybutyrate depolymerase